MSESGIPGEMKLNGKDLGQMDPENGIIYHRLIPLKVTNKAANIISLKEPIGCNIGKSAKNPENPLYIIFFWLVSYLRLSQQRDDTFEG